MRLQPCDVAEPLSLRCMSLLGLNASKSFSGTTTALRLRGFRAVRADRFFAVNIPKPRNSTRSPRASAAVIVSSMASTMASASRLYRCGFSAASFATSSDLIIRAQAFGSSGRREQAPDGFCAGWLVRLSLAPFLNALQQLRRYPDALHRRDASPWAPSLLIIID